MLLVYIIVAFAAGFLWLLAFRSKDKWEPEPWARLIKVAVAGGVAVGIAALVELIFHLIFFGNIPFKEMSFFPFVWEQLFIVGIVEELLKFGVVWIFAFHTRDFNEPVDGLIYAAAAAVGFSVVENITYAMEFGSGVLIVRVLLSTLAHIMFSSIWGYELGQYWENPAHPKKLIVIGLSLAALSHGLFNILVSHGITVAFGIIFVAVILWAVVKRLYRKAEAESAFRQ